MQFYASKRFNPDSYGFNYVDITWKGVVVENGYAKIVSLEGRNAMSAYAQAKNNIIYEHLSTGAIAAPVGYSASKGKKKKKDAKRQG